MKHKIGKALTPSRFYDSLSPQQRIDLFHLLGCQRTKLHCLRIFLHLCHGLEAWDRDRLFTARPDPRQRTLY